MVELLFATVASPVYNKDYLGRVPDVVLKAMRFCTQWSVLILSTELNLTNPKPAESRRTLGGQVDRVHAGKGPGTSREMPSGNNLLTVCRTRLED